MLLSRTVIEAPVHATRRSGALRVPRSMTFGVRSANRASILRASAALKRVAVDVPAGVRLDRVLEQ